MGVFRGFCGRLTGAVGLGLALAAGLVCAAQGPGETKTMLIMPPAPLLPVRAGAMAGSGLHQELAGELQAGEFGASAAAGIGSGDGGQTLAVLKEDGISRMATGQYAGQGRPVSVSAYQFGDATGAYSAYTFARSFLHGAKVTGGDARLGKASETTTDAAGELIWAGTAVMRVAGRVSATELDGLKAVLPKVSGRAGLAPLLPTYLPEKGVSGVSEKYALGPVGFAAMGGRLPPDVVDWSKSTEVISAEYDGRGLVTLLLYPTPQIAGDRGRALEKYVNGVGVAQFGTLKMRRVGPMLGMTTGGLTEEQAGGLIADLHLSQVVTFDKKLPPEFHAEVHKTVSLLQSIVTFCIIGTLAAVVLGVFLGGARAGIRVLQGKPAASEPEFLTINLRGEKKGLFAGKDTQGSA